jgi:hypothetical protein
MFVSSLTVSRRNLKEMSLHVNENESLLYTVTERLCFGLPTYLRDSHRPRLGWLRKAYMHKTTITICAGFLLYTVQAGSRLYIIHHESDLPFIRVATRTLANFDSIHG